MAGRDRGRRAAARPGSAGGPGYSAAPRFVVTALALLLLPLAGRPAAAGGTAGRQPAPAGGGDGRGPSLLEAAERNRDRIARSRRRGGTAPRYDDAALAAARPSGGAPPAAGESSAPAADESPAPAAGASSAPAASPARAAGASSAPAVGVPAAARRRNGEAAPAGEASPEPSERPDLRDPGPRGETSAAERAATRRERERALREQLLDLEWSLAAVGASGLPYAPRNPNRAISPLDTGRFRARQEEIRRELAALAEEAGAGKGPRPR